MTIRLNRTVNAYNVTLILTLMALLPMAVAYGSQETVRKKRGIVKDNTRLIQRIGEALPVRLVLVPTLREDAAHHRKAAFSLSHAQIFKRMKEASAKFQRPVYLAELEVQENLRSLFWQAYRRGELPHGLLALLEGPGWDPMTLPGIERVDPFKMMRKAAIALALGDKTRNQKDIIVSDKIIDPLVDQVAVPVLLPKEIAADMKEASRWLVDLAAQSNTRVFEATTGMFAGPEDRFPMFVQWIYSGGMPASPENPISLQETLEREIRFALQPDSSKPVAREGTHNTFLR